MRAFRYARPENLDEAVALLAEHGSEAQLLAGGTDLVIGLREGWLRPELVIDVKHILDLGDPVRVEEERFIISATAVMTDLEEHDGILQQIPALAEAARVVGSVQIRNRATLVGNICNASPAADTAPPLLVHDAVVVIAGPEGVRRLSIDDFIVGPGKTDLARGELVIAIEVPFPVQPFGAAYTRMTRRRGTDLASVTLCCGVDRHGRTRLSYGSVGPRPFLVIDESGALADPDTPEQDRADLLAEMFNRASPSLTSIRAGPDYRLAMLPVLGARALQAAVDRRNGSTS